jgi:acyl-CoA dehydrogenase
VDFSFPPELYELRETLRRFIDEEVTPRYPEIEKTGAIPEDLLRKGKELGLFGISIPEEYGGLSLSPLERCAVNEMLGRGPFGFASMISVHTGIGCIGIVRYGTEEQKRRYLPKMATGEYLSAFALTEPDAGSDPASMTTFAEKKGRYWYITGRKHFITNGSRAKIITVFARTSKDKPPGGISAFLVEPSFPGFQVGSVYPTLGHKGGDIAELVLDRCEVPEENLLGKEGEGLRQAYETLSFGRTFVGARCVGAGERALELTLQYAGIRKTFGKFLKDHEIVKGYLAEMSTLLSAARLLVYRSAYLLAKNHPAVLQSSQAKLFASEALHKIVDYAVQIHGGISYIEGATEIERIYRDGRIARIYDGASEIQKLIIARELYRTSPDHRYL